MESWRINNHGLKNLVLLVFPFLCSPAFSEGQLEHLLYSENHEDGEKYVANKYEYESLVAVFGKQVADYVVNHISYSKKLDPLTMGQYSNGKITVNPDLVRKFMDTYVIVHEACYYFSDTRGIALDKSRKTYRVDCLELGIGKLCSEQEAEIARAIGILLVGHKTIYGIWNGIDNFDFDIVFLRRSLYMYADDYMGIQIPESVWDIDPTEE